MSKRLFQPFILSCAAALACGFLPQAAARIEAPAAEERRAVPPVPKPGLESLQVTLLIRQMVLDEYDSTGTVSYTHLTLPTKA